VAGGGQLAEAGAVILFGILFLWQMPHFWALALRYRADYAAGGFPMVSERVGVEGTARLIQLYALGLTAWSLAAPTFGVGGPAALVAAAALGGRLIWLAAKFARQPTTSGVALPLSLLQFLPPPAIPSDGGGTADPHTLS